MNRKQTSPKVATKASKVLSDGRTSANSKSCAASALSQARKKLVLALPFMGDTMNIHP